VPDGTVRQAHKACEEGIFRHGPTAHDEAPHLLKRWWAGANHRSDQREFIRVLGREERVSVIAEESSPRGAYNASTYVLHRCGGCRWMPPLERLLNASRVANGVDDASAADALAAVWETRVLFTGKL
jgi:hypothetical protein